MGVTIFARESYSFDHDVECSISLVNHRSTDQRGAVDSGKCDVSWRLTLAVIGRGWRRVWLEVSVRLAILVDLREYIRSSALEHC